MTKGMMLNFITHGEPTDKPALLIAHGLFGSGRNWGVIAKRLSDERQVIAVDMRNHAGSAWSDNHSYADLAGDLAEVIASLGGPMHVLGHSMGGKAAMMLALTEPAMVDHLVVADIAPVAYGHSQMAPIEAMRHVELSHVHQRSDAAEQMVGIEDALKPFLLQSLDMKEKRWRLNLDVLAARMDEIIGFPEVAEAFDGPALFLSGAESDYVRQTHRGQIKALFPKARFAKIPGAGHWLHAERPREFEAAVRVFLNQ